MGDCWMLPKGSDLVKAVRWLSDQGLHDKSAIYEVALRFDLSVADEQFLLDHFVEEEGPGLAER